MRLVFRIVALYLAVIWLPATLCCSLEAAEAAVFCPTSACCDDSHGDQGGAEVCNDVEAGRYQTTAAELKAPPVILTLDVFLAACAAGAATTIPVVEGGADDDVAREWVAAWQFTRRAAAPAHAPDSSRG